MDGLEIFFLSLLGLSAVVITWFAGYVVYRLFAGQR